VCSPLVSGPQTNLGEVDMLNDDSYNWAERGVAPQLFKEKLSGKPPVAPLTRQDTKEPKERK
jgi:hypothetical protein